jgi:SanA protein
MAGTLLKTVLIMCGAVLIVIGLPRLYSAWRFGASIFPEASAPPAPVAIVFGAGLQRNGQPTLVLRDRVQTAARLYQAGKVQKLLLSGDNRFEYYNEPQAMFEYGLSLGVPEPAMVLDYAGRRTYDTCLRARQIFGVTEAVLVTQGYHLDRALLTCAALGLNVRGVAADLSAYPLRAYVFWWLRELPATMQALWDLYVVAPGDVVLGQPEPIVFR